MTSGPIMKNVLIFALPIVLGNILQQLYTTVDTLIIGKYCDYVSLAAVGTSSQPVEVLLCIFLGIGTGVSIIIPSMPVPLIMAKYGMSAARQSLLSTCAGFQLESSAGFARPISYRSWEFPQIPLTPR